MLLRALVLPATFALTATSFLIPPVVSNTASEVAGGLTFDPVNHNEQVLKLNCDGCMFAKKGQDEPYKWVPDIPNSLVLNFTVSETDSLDINGSPFTFYDPSVQRSDLRAVQISSKGSLDSTAEGTDLVSPPLRLAFRAGYEATRIGTDSNPYLMWTIPLKIRGLDMQRINVDWIEIRVLESPEGRHMIVSVETIPDSSYSADPSDHWKASEAIPGFGHVSSPSDHEKVSEVIPDSGLASSPSDEEKAGEAKECTALPRLCKWKSVLENRLHGMRNPLKGCHKSHPLSTHHYRQHQMRVFFHKMSQILIGFIIPLMIGIAFGMMVSLIGMVVGQLIVILWIKYGRGGKRGPYAKVEQGETSGEEINEVAAEKGVSPEGAPPAYEEPAKDTAIAEKEQEQH